MDCIVVSESDRDAELTALARLVIYGRDAAKALNANELEHCLVSALEAIVRELEGDDEVCQAKCILGELKQQNYQ